MNYEDILQNIFELKNTINELNELTYKLNNDYHENNITKEVHTNISYSLKDIIERKTYYLFEYIEKLENTKKG